LCFDGQRGTVAESAKCSLKLPACAFGEHATYPPTIAAIDQSKETEQKEEQILK
jgi:hypothetical protein